MHKRSYYQSFWNLHHISKLWKEFGEFVLWRNERLSAEDGITHDANQVAADKNLRISLIKS